MNGTRATNFSLAASARLPTGESLRGLLWLLLLTYSHSPRKLAVLLAQRDQGGSNNMQTEPASESALRATQICAAIQGRLLLAFDYNGLNRIVAPYCYGVSMRDVEVLRAIQLRGSSRSGGFGFGKLWALKYMSNVMVTDESFVPDDPEYDPEDSAMKTVICRIDGFSARRPLSPKRRRRSFWF